jgi:ribosomal protein S18 acetylase RimI-like enzyme
VYIKQLKGKSKKVAEFSKREWPIANEEHHFGHDFQWKTENFNYVAYDGNDVAGSLAMKVEVGVAYIETLIVGKDYRGKGVGKALIAKAEETAKEHKAHKIHLITGKTWSAVKFYESAGYKVTAELPNHYNHFDFVELTKFI